MVGDPFVNSLKSVNKRTRQYENREDARLRQYQVRRSTWLRASVKCVQWAIRFNATKTIQQTFSLKRNSQSPVLTFGGTSIPCRNNHKHQGLTFSKDLRFHEHINDICNKVNKTLIPLYFLARHPPRFILDQHYKIYIRPHFRLLQHNL